MTITHPPGPAGEAYLAALASGDRGRAWDVVDRLQQSGASPLDVMAQVIAPAQARVGVLWATDAWSVAQEHAATAVSEAVLARLGGQIPSAPDPAAPVVVSCVEQEWHALPALLVAEHLRADGLPVSYLGANASAEHLVRHVHETGPRAVALSCSLSASLPRVRRQVEAVRATGTPVVVGGAAFDGAGLRARTIGANAFATSGLDAVTVVRDLPRAVAPAEPLLHEGADEGFAVHADREELTAELRRRLDARLGSGAGPEPPPGWHRAVHDHLPHVVGALAGALVADDPRVIEETLTWLDEVLSHRHAPAEVTSAVTSEMTVVVREYPAATRLLAGR
jgi:MerR family transcriptional regulator, light-induced transcriptional regulator